MESKFEVKRIKLSNTGYAIVDDEDYKVISHWTWRKDQHGYATRVKRTYISPNKYKCTTIFMHRQILGTSKGMDTDHINRNRLDNRKANLRMASRSVNNVNAKLRKTNTSGYKGIRWHKQCSKWNAIVGFNGKSYSCGVFEKIEDAVEARQQKIKELYGDITWAKD